MATVKIQGKEHVIAKVFSDEFAFRIPEYQRPYAWTTEEAGELVEDLLSIMGDDDRIPIEDLSPYFLGSIVLIKQEGDADSEVVDGQQRLTTLTILLAALREVADFGDITPFIYQAKQRLVVGSEDRFRLLLRDEDQEFFKKYVQESAGFKELVAVDPSGLSDSRTNIVQNGKLFHERLSEIPHTHLERLAQFILNQCLLIVVTSIDRDSAYRIFSILNDRGLDLSHTDILKAEIVGGMPSDKLKGYAKKWVDLEDSLGREAFQELFAHIRMIYRRAKMRESILKEFREYVTAKHPATVFVDEVLVPYGEAYGEIRSESFESATRAEEINRLFSWLNRIDNSDWVPPALRYLKDHRSEPDKLAEFFVLLERLAASMFIRRVNITKRIERYGRVLKSLNEGADIVASDSRLQLSDQEKRETKTALDGPIYEMPRFPLYVLLRLDSVLSSGTATYQYKTISIEHVLPQTPKKGSEWLKSFPDDRERFSWTDRVGNLVLLNRRKNSSAGNMEFDKKKESYFKKGGVSPFALTTQVLNETAWTPDVLKQRQKDLLQKLCDVWQLD